MTGYNRGAEFSRKDFVAETRNFLCNNRDQAYTAAYIARMLDGENPPIKRVATALRKLSESSRGYDTVLDKEFEIPAPFVYLGHGHDRDSGFYAHRDYLRPEPKAASVPKKGTRTGRVPTAPFARDGFVRAVVVR